MDVRPLGSQGCKASVLGFGAMNLGGNYGAGPSESDAISVLHRAVELGVMLFDTAEVYGPFENEKLVGRALGGALRDRVLITTKFGWQVRDGKIVGLNSRPERIRAACDESLQRLGIDTIDIYYQHRVDPSVPMEDVAGTIGELVQAGKVRYFGLSEPGEEALRRAHAVHPVTAIENEYSLWTRDPEDWALETCRELGIGFVAYSPLGRGFLTGKLTTEAIGKGDMRAMLPRFQADAMAANAPLVDLLSQIAARNGCTTSQLALAWLLHQGDDIFPIPGTRRAERIEENVAATKIVLSPEELATVSHAVAPDKVQGARYMAAAMTNLAR